MPELLAHINCSLQHENAEGDAWNPGDEADNVEDTEEQENDAAAPVFAREHIKSRYEPKNNIQDAGKIDELFCERPRRPDIRVGKYDRHAEHESEENDRVRVQGELVCIAVNATTVVLRCLLLAPTMR